MKKLTAIVLFACLLFPFVGSYFLLKHEQKMVKRAVKHKIIEGVDRSELVYMKFSLADSKNKLDWKHSKEFKYKGEMYDIVEKEIQGDSIAYWLWWDHEETALYQKLNLLLAGINDYDADSQKKNTKNNIWNFAKKLYSQNSKPTRVEDTASLLHQTQTPYLKNWTSIYIETPAPPPKS